MDDMPWVASCFAKDERRGGDDQQGFHQRANPFSGIRSISFRPVHDRARRPAQGEALHGVAELIAAYRSN